MNMSERVEKVLEMELKLELKKEFGSGGDLIRILLLADVGEDEAFAYIKLIKPKQATKIATNSDDYRFEDKENRDENTSNEIVR